VNCLCPLQGALLPSKVCKLERTFRGHWFFSYRGRLWTTPFSTLEHLDTLVPPRFSGHHIFFFRMFFLSVPIRYASFCSRIGHMPPAPSPWLLFSFGQPGYSLFPHPLTPRVGGLLFSLPFDQFLFCRRRDLQALDFSSCGVSGSPPQATHASFLLFS